jgi:hypothetical protein
MFSEIGKLISDQCDFVFFRQVRLFKVDSSFFEKFAT